MTSNSNVLNISGNATVLDVCNSLPIFTPSSAGSYANLAMLTLLAANQCFPFLNCLMDKLGNRRLKVINIQEFAKEINVNDAQWCAGELKKNFDYYGSDKANGHNYHLMYGPILQDKRDQTAVVAILEFGLGTNNTALVSNMGPGGRPGASLRAFRDFLPNGHIYGADIDRQILFEEDRIKTYFVDQTDLSSFDNLDKCIPNDLDMIIDDGLHAPNANIAVLAFGLSKLKKGGWLIIEDIQKNALPIWHVVSALLPNTYECYLLSAALASVFAVKKLV